MLLTCNEAKRCILSRGREDTIASDRYWAHASSHLVKSIDNTQTSPTNVVLFEELLVTLFRRRIVDPGSETSVPGHNSWRER